MTDKPDIDYRIIAQHVEQVALAISNGIDRAGKPRLAAGHAALPGIVLLTTKVVSATFSAILFLARASRAQDATLSLSIPPLTRTIVDSLITLVFLLDAPCERTKWFLEAQWKESFDQHARLSEHYGNDDSYRTTLNDLEDYVASWKSDVPPDVLAEPSKARRWPQPGRIFKLRESVQSSEARALLEHLVVWHYDDLSKASHVTPQGLALRGGPLSALMGNDRRSEVLDGLTGTFFVSALGLYLATLSEVAAATALTETYNTLHILWQYLSPVREAARLYEMRYRKLLRS